MPCPEPDPTPASPSPCRERAGLASRGGGRRPSYGNSDAAAAFSAIRFSTLQKKVEKFPSAWQRLLSRTPGLSSASPDAVPRLDNPLHKTLSFAGHILRHFRGSSSECVCAYYVYVHIYVCTRVCVCVLFSPARKWQRVCLNFIFSSRSWLIGMFFKKRTGEEVLGLIIS